MNTLAFIKQKLELIESKQTLADLEIIIEHLEKAEKHFNNTIEEPDIDLFNDVIYRANQAYEGILRLAYETILGKSSKNKEIYQIEKKLVEEKIINERTIKYISLYRVDFRNNSTHNYRMKFTKSDAFLALNNVTSFLYPLIDKIITNDANIVIENKNNNIKEIAKDIASKNLSLSELLEEALIKFPKIYYSNPKGFDFDNGFNIIDELELYLEQINNKWKIISCPTITEEMFFRLDGEFTFVPGVLIKYEEENFIIEVCTDEKLTYRDNVISSITTGCELFEANYGIILQMKKTGDYCICIEETEPFLIKRVHKIENKEALYNE